MLHECWLHQHWNQTVSQAEGASSVSASDAIAAETGKIRSLAGSYFNWVGGLMRDRPKTPTNILRLA